MSETLETVSVTVPETALDAYEQALGMACRTIGFFLADEDLRTWSVEGVKRRGEKENELTAGLALAGLMTGEDPEVFRHATEPGGWLARTQSSFPEQYVGRRFAIRGTHLGAGNTPGRITLVLDAGVAFGSGEHGSTRGCLRALERVAYRRPRRILDLGCGSGILAMAAARLLGRPVLATDIDRWSVRVARENAIANGLSNRMTCRLATGWQPPARAGAPYDLVFANILARPLCAMAAELAANLAPGGTAILAGLLSWQARMVLSAHRRVGLVLEASAKEGTWTTLILRKQDGRQQRSAGEADDPQR
ncbi:50S ribosomal protein L11 methyltransferase [Acidisphaera sp. L21]|uniref:50S ribosomal protein L11 methyltransferase n=1 Tax=Acidisphaera sp. L21 TaxID=1641851 RepID=UPI00131D7C8F|nr:50S ribosomal protein L11 methyltransferase [Acidisphaera sp. L21]